MDNTKIKIIGFFLHYESLCFTYLSFLLTILLAREWIPVFTGMTEYIFGLNTSSFHTRPRLLGDKPLLTSIFFNTH